MTEEKDFRDIDIMGILPDDSDDESDDGFSITGRLGDVDDDIAEVLKTDYEIGRASVGKSVDLGGRRIIKKKKK